MGYNNIETLDFKGIIMKSLQKIFEISCSELKEQKKFIFSSNINNPPEIIQEDLRISYAQSIECLAILVSPYFDKITEASFKKFDMVMNDELSKYSKDNKVEIQNHFSENNYDIKSSGSIKLIEEFRKQHKVKYAKKLFFNINLLLKNNRYFKTLAYGDNSSNGNGEVIDDEELKDLNSGDVDIVEE